MITLVGLLIPFTQTYIVLAVFFSSRQQHNSVMNFQVRQHRSNLSTERVIRIYVECWQVK